MRAAGNQPGGTEFAQIPACRPCDETVAVALGMVLAREQFQKRHAIEHFDEAAQSAAKFRRAHVMQRIGTHDQVEAPLETQVFQIAEFRQAQVARAPA